MLHSKFYILSHGRRTSKTSQQGESRAEALAFGFEKSEAFGLQKLQRAENTAQNLRSVRQVIDMCHVSRGMYHVFENKSPIT